MLLCRSVSHCLWHISVRVEFEMLFDQIFIWLHEFILRRFFVITADVLTLALPTLADSYRCGALKKMPNQLGRCWEWSVQKNYTETINGFRAVEHGKLSSIFPEREPVVMQQRWLTTGKVEFKMCFQFCHDHSPPIPVSGFPLSFPELSFTSLKFRKPNKAKVFLNISCMFLHLAATATTRPRSRKRP